MSLLERLYDDHAQVMFAFALDLTRDEANTRDILQSIFCRIAEKPALLRGVRDERAFLLRMVYTRVVDASRRRNVREAHAADAPAIFDLPEDPDAAQFRESLAAALDEIPTDQRAIVHLKLWQGLTFDEIARTLDIPANTAASRYRYGIDKLRTLLRPLYEEIR